MGIHQRLAAGRPVLSDVHLLGKLRGGPFQVRAERQGGQAMGKIQTQRADELREIQQSHAILLQDRRSVAGPRQKAGVQIRTESYRMAHGQPKLQIYVLDDLH